MQTIRIETDISAPLGRCFDLARSVEAHTASTSRTGERAVEDKTRGLLVLGDEVTWRGRHFGMTQEFTSRITQFERPSHFQDTMVRGAFASFVHDHSFLPIDAGTRMVDVVEFAAPLGVLGRVAEVVVLAAYLRRFLAERGQFLKGVAETEAWRQFVTTG